MEIINKPSLVVHPHALVGDGRITEASAFLLNETLGAYIKRTGVIVPAGPVLVWHNGYRVPDALWRRLIPRDGDQVVIRARVLGGGGGGSKVLRTVAMIALVLAAPELGGLLAESAFGTALGMSAGFASGMIMIGGSLLINALLPPPKATAAQIGVGSKYESSPTYAISGGRNRMRLWEPMTIIFGRHKVVPDLAANYYTEYVGDDQYLNQAFHFGLQGDAVSITDIRIGDTPIVNFKGVQLQDSPESGALTMFPGNVDTIQGFGVSQKDGWQSRTSPIDTTQIKVEIAAQLFTIRDDGTFAARSVDVQIQYRNVTGSTWVNIGGRDTVYATHYWSLGAIYDGVWRQGAFGSTNPSEHYEGEKAGIIVYWSWRPHPYRLGQPWQGIAPDPVLVQGAQGLLISGAKQEPVRTSVSRSVAKGQYEIRVRKVTGDVKDSRNSNEVAVNQILCYQPDTATYTGQARLGVRIKATAQLNGAIDELSAICSVSCPVWTGSAWVTRATSNPAWWFLWFARGATDPVTGDRLYGGGMADSQIDLDAIKAWGLWCDAKGLTFDYVLDRKISTAEMLQIIARAGRASPTWQTGKLGVVWDAANLPVTAMFGPFNIKAGSFKVDYIGDSTADEIVLNFINPARAWGMDEVRVKVPGATTTNNPLQLDFDGCTNPAMAGREANLLAASQVWHRRRVSWEADIEGWVAGRGDVVQMSHDLTVWGYSGRVYGRAGNVITLDKSIPSGGSGTMMIRGPENQMRTVTVTSDVGDVDVLTITSDMTGFPLPGDDGYEGVPDIDWAWFFDPMATPGRRFKITEVQPSEDGVKFSAIDDDAGYYASESNPYLYTPPRDGAYLGGVVFGISFNESLVNVQADISNVQIGWALSTAMPADVVVSINDVAQPWIRSEERQITVQAQTNDVINVTVTPISPTGRGTPASQQYVVQGLTAPLPAVTGLTNVFRDGLTALVWNRVVDVRQPEYEIRLGASWDNSRTVAIVQGLDALAVGNGLYWVAARFASRGYVVHGPADSLQVSGATLVRNVLLTEVEHPAWAGELGGGTVVLDGELTLPGIGDILSAPDVLAIDEVLWYGGAAPTGTYRAANSVDIGYVAPVRIDFDIDAYGINFNENVLSLEDIFAVPDILGGSNAQYWRVRPQIRHAADDLVFTDWLDYTPGLINARHFEVRLVLETDDTMIVPFVRGFTWVVDVPDMIDRAEGVTVPSGGMTVTYAKSFHAVPNVQIATFDAVNGDRYVLTDSTETSFHIQFFNGATAVSRVMNRISQGY